MESNEFPLFDFVESSGDIDSEESKRKQHLKTQTKVFYVTCYPEHFVKVGSNDLIKDFIDHINFFGAIRYYFILHDKDYDVNGVPIKPHFHLIIVMDKVTLLSKVVNYFCLSNYPWAVQKLKNINAMLRYFTHVDYPNKYQYSVSDIVSNDLHVLEKVSYNMSEYAIFLRYYREAESQHMFSSMLDLCEWCLKNGFEFMLRNNTYLLKTLYMDGK